ncbi:MAG: MBOAT family protein [Chitinophagaceae bacterium]|nr:MBOAT family protein [Chitinophagaceae bacterium]
MVFTSFNFLVFFPTVLVVYFLLPQKFRWMFLLAASYYFYINIKPVYALLLAGVTLTTYIFTNLIAQTNSEKGKRLYLTLAIVLTLLPLFFFKYFNFVNEGIYSLLNLAGLHLQLPQISLLLPVGISFYTFMALGYTIDVYNEEVEVEKNFGIVALFLSFFPVVMSGPIERASNMFHQFRGKLQFSYEMAVSGLQLMLWGYFMKLALADRLSIYIDAVFKNVDQHVGSSLMLATLMQPIRVYGDLGGYSLIAIGCAKVMGINVIPNFNRPFFATTMSEFWRRWHMSLIKWLTDYVYTPLSFAFRRYGKWGIVIALNLTFIISGAWHGAALNFLVWGFIQGVALSVEMLTRKRKDAFEARFNLSKKWWYIMFGCVFTYLLFAFSLSFGGDAATVPEVLKIMERIFTDSLRLPYKDGDTMLYGFIAFSILFLKDFMEEYYPGRILLFNNKNNTVRWLSYYTVIFLIFYLGIFSGEQFVYFQF